MNAPSRPLVRAVAVALQIVCLQGFLLGAPLELTLTSRDALELRGNTGERYRVQYSPDLQPNSWQRLRDITIRSGPETFSDASASVVDRRFYRAFRPSFLADSYRDFSGIQSQNGWLHGYKANVSTSNYSTTPFTQMTFGTEFMALLGQVESAYYVTAADHWTNIRRSLTHPNGTIMPDTRAGHVIHWAIRRWISQHTGPVLITVNVADADARPDRDDNGVVSRIFVDGLQVDETNLDVGEEKEVTLFTYVTSGTIIDFVIDPKDGNHLFDDTWHQVFIEAVP